MMLLLVASGRSESELSLQQLTEYGSELPAHLWRQLLPNRRRHGRRRALMQLAFRTARGGTVVALRMGFLSQVCEI